MKVIGSTVALAAATTKVKDDQSVRLVAGAAGDVTIRNAADDDDFAVLTMVANEVIVLSLEPGQGLRGANTFKATPLARSGY
jgi:hypothetical protein